MSVKVALAVALTTAIVSCHAANLHGATRRHSDIVKRSAPFSFYDITTGEVACGGFYSPNDHVVALNAGMFDGGSHCGKQVTITYNGKSQTATIVDECMKCDNGLDLTEGLFQEFASEDAGIVYGTWSYGSGAAAPDPEPKTTSTKKNTPTPSPTPTPTPTPKPKTTSTSKVHTTSTTSTTPTSTSTSTTKTSSAEPTTTSSSSSSVASTSSSSAAVPTALGVQLGLGTQNTADLSGTQNLVALNSAIISFGAMVVS